jgi:hypothetical protein
MKAVNALIFDRSDLNKDKRNMPLGRVQYSDFIWSRKTITGVDLILFIDIRETIIIKNRWGNEGIVGKYKKPSLIKRLLVYFKLAQYAG